VETAAELDLPVDHTSVRQARIFATEFDAITPERLADVQLVVSELVTNALLHGGLNDAQRIVLSISRDHGRLRIDVDDAGGFTADSESFDYSRTGGREHGLRIVQRLGLEWRAENGRVTAWLEA
jgi:anti-sigma regulatory factor (Ser/Thr protein kinase)